MHVAFWQRDRDCSPQSDPARAHHALLSNSGWQFILLAVLLRCREADPREANHKVDDLRCAGSSGKASCASEGQRPGARFSMRMLVKKGSFAVGVTDLHAAAGLAVLC